jgi:hypothetical protein
MQKHLLTTPLAIGHIGQPTASVRIKTVDAILKGLERMKKIKPLYILIAVLFIVTIVVYVFFRPVTKTTLPAFTPSANALNSGTIAFSPPPEDKLIISGVDVNNFYKDDDARSGANSIFFENEEYQLGFVLDRNLFVITILDSPFGTIQSKAEQRFLQELGIKKDDACKLNVIVQTPHFVSPEESKQTRTLSFCQ